MFRSGLLPIFLAAEIAAQTPTISLATANIVINPTATDSYTLQGSFLGLSLSTAQSAVLNVGQFSGTIPMGGFVQQPGTNVFQYQDSTGLSPYRVSSLSLDLDAQTFTAQACEPI